MSLHEKRNLHTVATAAPEKIDKFETCSGELRLRREIMELLTKYPIPAGLLTGDYSEEDLGDVEAEPVA